MARAKLGGGVTHAFNRSQGTHVTPNHPEDRAPELEFNPLAWHPVRFRVPWQLRTYVFAFLLTLPALALAQVAGCRVVRWQLLAFVYLLSRIVIGAV